MIFNKQNYNSNKFAPPIQTFNSSELEKIWNSIVYKRLIDKDFLVKYMNIPENTILNGQIFSYKDIKERAEKYISKINRNNLVDFILTFAKSLGPEDYTKFVVLGCMYLKVTQVYEDIKNTKLKNLKILDMYNNYSSISKLDIS